MICITLPLSNTYLHKNYVWILFSLLVVGSYVLLTLTVLLKNYGDIRILDTLFYFKVEYCHILQCFNAYLFLYFSSSPFFFSFFSVVILNVWSRNTFTWLIYQILLILQIFVESLMCSGRQDTIRLAGKCLPLLSFK